MSSSKTRKTRPYVRASEVGQYVYCARAWWWNTVQGVQPANVDELQDGQTMHRQHGRRVVAYHRLHSLGWVFLLAALSLSIILLWILTHG